MTLRLEVDGITFSWGKRKLVVARSGIARPAHVTLSWDNRSGEVDLHLTFEPSDDSPVRKHVPLLRLRPADLAAEMERAGLLFHDEVVRRLFPLMKPTSPEWLQSRGYVLVVPDEDALASVLSQVVPKKRGKRRWPGFEPILRDPRLTEALLRSEEPRSLLQTQRSKVNWPLTALPTGPRLGRRPALYVYGVRMADGTQALVRIPQRTVSRIVQHAVADLSRPIMRHFRPKHAAIWDAIVSALELDRVPALRRTVERVRKFLLQSGEVAESDPGSAPEQPGLARRYDGRPNELSSRRSGRFPRPATSRSGGLKALCGGRPEVVCARQ